MPIVIPSYLQASPKGATEDTGHQTNDSLRLGEVVDLIYPTDDRSISKKFIEYAVEVTHRDGNGPQVANTYIAIVGNLFGTNSDTLQYTLRPRPSTSKGKKSNNSDNVYVGSKVLILCVNGSKSHSIIVGGVRDVQTGDEGKNDIKDLGHNLLFQFNGLRAIINKDGEFEITFNGATDEKNKLKEGVDKANGGTLFHFLKDGNLAFGNNTEVMTLDHGNKSWSLEADQDYKVTMGGAWNAEIKEGINFQGKKSIDFNTDKTLTITAKNVSIGSSSASESYILGDTYRQAESQLMNSMSSSLTTIGTAATTMNAALLVASTALKVPIAGGILASPSFAAMNVQLALIIVQILAMTEALQAFEAGKTTYLSKKIKGE